MSARAILGLLVVATLAACGGGGGTGARDGRGNAIVSRDGTAVTQEAHNRWRAALDAFKAVTAWNEEACSDIASKFEAANDAQGGNFTEAIYMIGLTAQRCGDRERARSFFNRALEISQTFCKARAALGVLQMEDGREQEAFATFQRSIRDDTRCTEGYVNIAAIQRSHGGADVREALNNLRRALAIESQYLPAFNQMALLYLDLAASGDNTQMLDLAQVVCRQAQLIDRNYAPIYNTWGLIFVKKNDIIQALRMFEQAMRLDNDMFEAFMNFGQITLSFRGYEDAKNAFTRAVELQADDYDAHIGLGMAQRGLTQMQAAQAEYERAIQIDAARPEAYFNLGLLFQDYMSGSVEDMNRAKQYYEQFLSKVGNNQRFADTVEAVRRRCRVERQGRRRARHRSDDCRPGRIQNIDTTIEQLRLAADVQARAREIERQQQQQEGGGGN